MIDLRKPSHILFFIVFLPGLSFGVSYALFLLWPDVPFWFESLSPLAAYGLFYGLFERYLWKWPLFRAIGVVTLPKMAGRWYGEQLSSYKKDGKGPTKSRVILEVEQTFSHIKATTYYRRWQSQSSVSCMVTLDGEPYLMLIYNSEANIRHADQSAHHKGVAYFRLLPGEDKIIGSYFNTQGTSGTSELKRSTKPLLHRFSEEA